MFVLIKIKFKINILFIKFNFKKNEINHQTLVHHNIRFTNRIINQKQYQPDLFRIL